MQFGDDQQAVPSLPRRAAPDQAILCLAMKCPALPCLDQRSELPNIFRYKASEVTGFLRSPVAEADAPSCDVEPGRKLSIVNEFVVGFHGERHRLFVELRPRPQNAVALHDGARRELRRLAQFLGSCA